VGDCSVFVFCIVVDLFGTSYNNFAVHRKPTLCEHDLDIQLTLAILSLPTVRVNLNTIERNKHQQNPYFEDIAAKFVMNKISRRVQDNQMCHLLL
jgi:hypothetical protein